MKPSEENPTSPQKMHPMVVMQPGERIVCEIKRHPIGILMLYIGAFLAIAFVAVALYFVMPTIREKYGADADTMVLMGGGIVLTGIILMLFVSTTVYWQNMWVVTTDSITQITQNGLFGRQVSQLSMENLEDVTVMQDGILPHIFNYGMLKAETAGERSKFVFLYCPDPNECARLILDAHEKFLEDRRNIQYAGSAVGGFPQQAPMYQQPPRSLS
ncbi:MAG TPA: PH domain-containing protein [Candidatus Saccharimonadales bacterium]